MIRYPLIGAAIAVAGGIAIADLMGLPVAAWAAMLIGALLALWGALRRRYGVWLCSLAVLVAVGGMASSGSRVPSPVAAQCGKEAHPWRMRVDGPVARWLHSDGSLRRTSPVRLVAERCGDRWLPRHGRGRLTLKHGASVVRGDLVELRAVVEGLPRARNPMDPDPQVLARRRGYTSVISVRSAYAIVARSKSAWRWLDRAREQVAVQLQQHIGPRLLGVASALCLGEKVGIAPAHRRRWADAGMSHLLAISGLHVGMVASLLYLTLTLILRCCPPVVARWPARTIAAAATIPMLFTYCVWVGAPPSAMRATVMATALLAGVVLGRPSAAPNALGLAAVGLLVVDPTSLYDLGFLLSFTAVAALLWLPRGLGHGKSGEGRQRRIRGWIVNSVAASVVATLATAPFIAHAFGRVSIIAPVTNLLAVPLATWLVTPLAMAYALATLTSDCLSRGLGWALDRGLLCLDWIATTASRIPGAAVDLPPPSGWEISALAMLAAGALARPFPRGRKIIVWVGTLVLLGSASARVLERYGGDGQFHLYMPYVGQGDGMVAIFPNGDAMVVDAGGAYDGGVWDPGERVMAPLLRRLGVRSIDVAVVTHPHPDHIGGFAYLASAFPIRELWSPGLGEHAAAVKNLYRAVRQSGGRVEYAATLPARIHRAGVTIEVLHPRPPEDRREPSESPPLTYPDYDWNDNSIVLRLSHGTRTLLLTGDIEAQAERQLAPSIAPTQVLKAPHHGSRTSCTEDFLAAVKPLWVGVSCGHRNRFRFPHDNVVARLRAHGARVLRTDLNGMLHFTSDGDRWRIATLRDGLLQP